MCGTLEVCYDRDRLQDTCGYEQLQEARLRTAIMPGISEIHLTLSGLTGPFQQQRSLTRHTLQF